MEKLIIDRVEGDIAVCELADKTMVDIELIKLPDGVSEGDVIGFDGETYFVDRDETNNRRQRIQNMMDDLFVD